MRLIGMVHVAPLPGSPRWDGSMERLITAAVADAHTLIESGMDALLIENYGDAPFTPGGCCAQAWGVAETLRAHDALTRAMSTEFQTLRKTHHG